MPEPRRKTVMLSVHQGFAARSLLQSGVLTALRDAGAKVVVLAPNPDEAHMREELETAGVALEQLHSESDVLRRAAIGENRKRLGVPRRSLVWWYVYNLRNYGLGGGGASPAFREKYDGFQARHGRKRPIRARTVDLGVRALWRSPRLRKRLLALDKRLFPLTVHADAFDRHRPDVVVTTSPGWFLPDAVVLREAEARGAATASVVLGWDNPTSKGYRGADPDRIFVWSQRMADQVVRHHDYPRERVSVSGPPQFDVYRNGGLPTREQLFADLGLDPGRRLVVFATGSPGSYTRNEEVARLLAEAVQRDELGSPAQLVVRLHPINFRPDHDTPLGSWQSLAESHPHVKLDVPEVRSQLMRCDLPPSDRLRIGALIRHADVLVNLFSTTMIEAFLLDTPVVLLSPAATIGGARPNGDARAFRDYAHVRAALAHGPARIAESEEQLLDHIRAYLADPSLDRVARARAAAEEAGPADGRAGERIARELLELAR